MRERERKGKKTLCVEARGLVACSRPQNCRRNTETRDQPNRHPDETIPEITETFAVIPRPPTIPPSSIPNLARFLPPPLVFLAIPIHRGSFVRSRERSDGPNVERIQSRLIKFSPHRSWSLVHLFIGFATRSQGRSICALLSDQPLRLDLRPLSSRRSRRGAFPSELLHSVSSVASSRRSESAISLARNDVGEFERRPSTRLVRKRTYVSLAKFRVTTEREWTKDPARFLVGWIFNSTPRSIEFEARAVGLRAIEGFMRIDFP